MATDRNASRGGKANKARSRPAGNKARTNTGTNTGNAGGTGGSAGKGSQARRRTGQPTST